MNNNRIINGMIIPVLNRKWAWRSW
jgi:hypothetical protein